MEQVQKIEKRNKHKPRIGGGASIVIYCLIFAYCCMGRNNYNDGGDSEPNPKKKQHSRWASWNIWKIELLYRCLYLLI